MLHRATNRQRTHFGTMESRGLLVLAAVFAVGVVAQNEREFDLTVSSCRSKEADIFFVLDSSSSIYIEDYDRQRQFLREVVNRLDIDPQFTRVGALTYSDNYQVAFNLGEYSTKPELIRAINNRNVPYLTGLTNTADAIRFVRTSGQFRENVVRAIVVVTDGYSRQPGATNQESEIARREGFYMFVIGVGQYTDEREWRAIANDPDNNFMYNITDYGALENLYFTIPNRICFLPPITISTGTCVVRESSDLIFVAGPREANSAFTVVTNVVDKIRDDQSRLRLSLLLGECKANEVPLSNPDLFCDSFGSTNPRRDSYSNLLKEMRAEARDARSSRPEANQVAVLFIDQESMELDRFGILREARDAQFDGIEMFVVDLGVSTYNNFLTRIASGERNLLTTSGSVSMRQLESQLLTKACEGLNERQGVFTRIPPV